jgi:hypothetical protein
VDGLIYLTKWIFTDYNEIIQELISMFDENTKKPLDKSYLEMNFPRYLQDAYTVGN